MTGKLRVREVFRDSTRRLLVVESVGLKRDCRRWYAGVTAVLEPYAVVIVGPGGERALDVEACHVDLARLKDEVPQLDAFLREAG